MANFGTNRKLRKKLHELYTLSKEILDIADLDDEDMYNDEENAMLDECKNVIDTYENIFVY